ncbi:MAG TPA: hypothetical protein VFM32_08580 [Spongiibacteraceae bacterium]|nr:hypothetical protein [Spongiibacteraceae bacterium]
MQTSQNTAAQIATSWHAIEEMTQSLRTAASERNWSAVLDQAAARHTRLQQHFAAYPIGPDNADFYRNSINRLLDGEKTLDALVRDARKSLMAEGANMSHSHRALGAYLNSSTR